MGVVFWGGFNTALEATNTTSFCVSCHEMHDNVYEELQGTVHFTNRSGVRAGCPDCHVPHEWTRKIARKMQASKEVWGHVFGSISTREAFLDLRRHLAESEWARMKANDSLECRNCHSTQSMDLARQNPRAAARTSVSCSPGSGPASTATRASRTGCRTCPASGVAVAMRPAVRRARVLFGGAAVSPCSDSDLPSPRRARAKRRRRRPVRSMPGGSSASPTAPPCCRSGRRASAASKDTRPEVKEFAREMARFRGQQVERLRAVAQERSLRLPGPEDELEHRVVLQNLEPLDYLALSRRYAEVQVQALEQEIRGYEAAARGADDATKQLSAEMLPQLRPRLEALIGCMTR
jgi:nitrate/TMAO reductase-like tetraheme cytochrome c subunit